MKPPVIEIHDHGQWQSAFKSIIAVLLANGMIEVEGSGAVAEGIRRQAAEMKDGEGK